jgi:hypothetical protein
MAGGGRDTLPVGELMIRRSIVLAAIVFLAAGCTRTALPPVQVDTPAIPSVGYLDDVAPILDQRCVVCHSCYNAPCQLQLSSYEGVDRGGSKQAVYSSSRLTNQEPTRLFIDAQTTQQWRDKGFHSVTANTATGDLNASLMLHALDAKRKQPAIVGSYHPEADGLTCPADTAEMGSFLARNPAAGMPFGFPALSSDEFATLATWLQQGAAGPNDEQRKTLETASASAQVEIAKWESFLNQGDAKHAMTARYLYEHYFLAHLHFSDSGADEFFRLVRSATPPGRPLSPIATVRPYDPPTAVSFYYRFEKIHSTIVHKTHMVVEFGKETLGRIQKSFIDTPWLEEPHEVEWSDSAGANPFLIYAQIPPEVRYGFLLDNSEYILRTFIRGPVCKGQVALNVIHDHFWVMFMDPKADQTVQNPEFLVEQATNLSLPNELGSDERIVHTFSNRYRDRYKRFYRAKSDLYGEKEPGGHAIDSIWKGERAVDAPVLTIYRHFDSASVHKGVMGDLPRTLWVIDYSQFERIYYALVAGFDVFGNVSHQVNVRRYMDYLRIEGELNFIEFLPRDQRIKTLESWYLGDRAMGNVDHAAVASSRATRIEYQTADPKRELIETIVNEHISESAEISFDEINYSGGGKKVAMPDSFGSREDILDGLRALTAPGTGLIKHLNGSEANLLFVRFRNDSGEDHFFTIVINRWHDNVNSMFKEGSRLDPSKDTIDFIRGSIGSYPNYFLEVDIQDVPDFFDMLQNFDGSDEYTAKIEKYGVNRAADGFWSSYDWFQARLDESEPLRAGRYDLNRYYSLARP